MKHLAKTIALCAMLCAAGCRGPLYQHTEHYYSVVGVQTRNNDPRVADEVTGAVGAQIKGNSIASGNKAIAK